MIQKALNSAVLGEVEEASEEVFAVILEVDSEAFLEGISEVDSEGAEETSEVDSEGLEAISEADSVEVEATFEEDSKVSTLIVPQVTRVEFIGPTLTKKESINSLRRMIEHSFN
jgi:hypothetical protein